MGLKRSIVRACGVGCLMALGAVAAPTSASAHGGGHGVQVLYEGLSSPKGLATTWGSPVVAQGAFGPPGPVLVFPQFGRDRGEAIPITEPDEPDRHRHQPEGRHRLGHRPRRAGRHVWLFHRLHDGTIDPVFDITAYQATDPDPHDQEGIPDESNPYGLTVDRKGNVLVADAAGNDIIRVTPHGDPTTVARFDLKTVSTDHLPPEMGLPPEMTAEAVPTTVTVGPDGCDLRRPAHGLPVPARVVERLAHRPARQGGALLGEHTQPGLLRVPQRA